MVRYPLSSPRSEFHQNGKRGSKIGIFYVFSNQKLLQYFCQVIMLKKILTQATPKMPKNTILEPFWTIFCHFDGLRPTKNLEGIVRSIGIYLLKIWRKITLPPQECPELLVIKPNHTLQMQHNKKYLFFWKIKQHLIFKIGKIGTGKSLSEALIFASTNLQ